MKTFLHSASLFDNSQFVANSATVKIAFFLYFKNTVVYDSYDVLITYSRHIPSHSIRFINDNFTLSVRALYPCYKFENYFCNNHSGLKFENAIQFGEKQLCLPQRLKSTFLEIFSKWSGLSYSYTDLSVIIGLFPHF